MSVVQYGKNIYYYATRDIEIGDEMLVWYHESYYQFWGVPLMLAQELDKKNGKSILADKMELSNEKRKASMDYLEGKLDRA
jgi:hypothetical protein